MVLEPYPHPRPRPPLAWPAAGVQRQRPPAPQLDELMDAKTAQRTPVVRIPALLSPAEIAELRAAYMEIRDGAGGVSFGGNDSKAVSQRGGKWETCYLHTGGMIKAVAPAIYAKIIDAAFEADRGEVSRCLHSCNPYGNP